MAAVSDQNSASEDEEARKVLKPVVASEAAISILHELWGVAAAKLRQLESYDDVNFAVTAEGGVKYTLKVHNGVESMNAPLLHAQNAIMAQLSARGVVCPTPVAATGAPADEIAERSLPTRAGGTVPLALRLLTWVDGTPMSDAAEIGESTLFAAGAFLGTMSAALASFDHPAVHREHAWDLRQTPSIRTFVPYIGDVRRRRLVNTVLDAFESEVQPCDSWLPRAVIHGDFNDANIILRPGSTANSPQVTGVIDFGDCVHTWRINELAIAMAYSMLSSWGKNEGNHLAACGALLRGFLSSSSQLDPREISLLRVLTACRLACSYTFGNYSYSQDPSNEYLLLHANPAGRALEVWFEETPKEELLGFLGNAASTTGAAGAQAQQARSCS